jgi:predicted helicase
MASIGANDKAIRNYYKDLSSYQQHSEREGTLSDPNNPEDGKAIVTLVERVTRVSVETVKIVKGLPEDFGG